MNVHNIWDLNVGTKLCIYIIFILFEHYNKKRKIKEKIYMFIECCIIKTIKMLIKA